MKLLVAIVSFGLLAACQGSSEPAPAPQATSGAAPAAKPEAHAAGMAAMHAAHAAAGGAHACGGSCGGACGGGPAGETCGGACGGGEVAAAEAPAVPADATWTELKVTGMHCGGCARRIQGALAKVDGVVGVEVDVASATVKVAVASGQDARALAAPKIAALGYGVAN